MPNQRAIGGNAKVNKGKAKVEIAKKSALLAVPIPNPPKKPVVTHAANIDEAISQLKVSFKYNLQKLDGSESKEKVDINSLDDLSEQAITQGSDTLNELVEQKKFLHQFQNALRNNKRFQTQLTAFFKDENEAERQRLLSFLKVWIGQLKEPSPAFLNWLRD